MDGLSFQVVWDIMVWVFMLFWIALCIWLEFSDD